MSRNDWRIRDQRKRARCLCPYLTTGDPVFLDLCRRNLPPAAENRERGMDQIRNKQIEQSSWFESHLWGACWKEEGLTLAPVPLPPGRTWEGSIHTPAGPVSLRATRAGSHLMIDLFSARSFAVRVRVNHHSITMPPSQRHATIKMTAPGSDQASSR